MMNIELREEQLKREMRARGLNTKGLMFFDYRKTLTVDQEKQLLAAKNAAEKRTLELQELFPTMLGINTYKQNAEWLANFMKKNGRIGVRVSV